MERLWNNNPDALNQMYKEMMDAYEERYRENNSTVNLDPITVDEYDAISREAVNRYYEHLKNNPSLSNEDVMRMTGDMSEKYFSAVEEYKNAVQQKEKSEDRGEKENRTEKYEAQNPENRSIFNPDRVSVEEYDKTLRDQVNKYYEHLKNDPSLSNEDVMRMTEEMSEKYLTAVEEYRNAQKQEDEGFQEKSGDKESTEKRYKRYKKEEIEKENPEHKRDVENQRKEEVEEENKSEKKDKLENREDEKDYEEEGAENKDKTETLSEDELEEERWNESESEDEAELLSDKAEAGEEQNAEDKAVTETESELQDNAADLSSEESSGETEDNSETEDNVEDLSSEESSEETEDESEKEDKDEDLSSEEGTEETEDESEEEDKAENKKVIVLDPGHSAVVATGTEPLGPGSSEQKAADASGTRGISSGVPEYELTLNISVQLKEVLEQRGYQVVLTRESNNVPISCVQRAEVANNLNADVYVRIHANGSENSNAKGAMTICTTPNNPYNASIYGESKALSEAILDKYCEVTGCNKEYVWETDTMSGNNWSQVPVTIVEMGYMTNPEEDVLMQTAEYQQKMVQGIADGIDAYMENY